MEKGYCKFKEMSSMSMSQEDKNAMQQAESYLSKMQI